VRPEANLAQLSVGRAFVAQYQADIVVEQGLLAGKAGHVISGQEPTFQFSRWRRCWRSLPRGSAKIVRTLPSQGRNRSAAGHRGSTTVGAPCLSGWRERPRQCPEHSRKWRWWRHDKQCCARRHHVNIASP
jgi:hypothetical protein